MEQPSPPIDALPRALRYLDRRVSEAVRRFSLIAEGERVLVALSGGKDSRVLLEVLAARRRWARERYELAACHVRKLGCTTPGELAQVEARCAELGVPLEILEHRDSGQIPQEPLADGSNKRSKSECFACAWQRRKLLFESAARQGCRVVALGHHRDDLAETVLLNLLYRGEVSTMYPRQSMFGGEIVLVRPLALVDERDVARVARLTGATFVNNFCNRNPDSRRQRMKALIRELSEGCPGLRANLLKPVLADFDPARGGHAPRTR